MSAKKRKEIKRAMTAIANGAEARMPLWTVLDNYTIRLLRDAVDAINKLEKNRKS